MARSQMIAIREPGKKLSQSFMDTALKQYTTAFGYASPQGAEGVHVKVVKANEFDLKDSLEFIEKEYAKDRVFYVFTQSDEPIDDGSLQPYKLLDNGEEGEERKVLLACITDGDFEAFAPDEDNAGQTNDYVMITQHIEPKLASLMEVTGPDTNMLTDLLYKPPFKEHITEALSPRGAVTIIPADKEKMAIGFGVGTEPGKWEWGWSSKTLGLQDKKPAESAAPAKKGGLSMKKIAAQAEEPQKEEEKKEEQVQETGDPKVKYAPLLRDDRFYLNNNTLWVKPWTKGETYKGMRSAFIKHFGAARVPQNSENPNPETGKIISAGRPFEELIETSNIRLWALDKLGQSKQPKEADTVQAPVADPDKERVKPPGEMALRVTKEQKQRYVDTMIKQNLIRKVDRAKLEEYVAKYPRFSQDVGENFSDILLWSPETIRRLGDVATHALVCSWHELRCEKLGLYEKAAPAKVEAPVVEEAAPAKKPGLSMKKMQAA